MVVGKPRKRNRFSPGAAIDERARAATGAKPVRHFGETKSIFSNENNQAEKQPQIRQVATLQRGAFLVREEGSD